MFELFTNKSRNKALEIYEGTAFIFSFIHSVLAGIQNGGVFADNQENPNCVFVIHDFGWSQFFGRFEPEFLRAITEFVFIEESFSSIKIRLFCPEDLWSKPFEKYADIAERCQFRIPEQEKSSLNGDIGRIEQIGSHNLLEVNKQFDLYLFSRNWPSKPAFENGSFGVVIRINNEYASICYSCASANEVHEIDIFTKEKFREKGFGKLAAQAFINEAVRRKKIANWDCFTNNLGSMGLANSLGFQACSHPYKFFTYNRRK